MKFKIIIGLLLAFSVISCQKKDEREPDNELVGAWYLVQNTQDLNNIEHYDRGKIRWNFTSNTNLNVQLIISPNLDVLIDQDGDYNYTYKNDVLTVDYNGTSLVFDVFVNQQQMILSYDNASGGRSFFKLKP